MPPDRSPEPPFDVLPGAALDVLPPFALEGPPQDPRAGSIPTSFLRRSRNLLRSAAGLLGVNITLVTPDSSVRIRGGRFPSEGGSCRASCRDLIASRCREVFVNGEETSFSCPDGHALALFPVPGGERVGAVLVSCDQRAHRRPRRALERRRAFLRDLARSLSDQLVLHKGMSALAGELSTRNDELHIFYSAAGRLAGRPDVRRSLRQMLDQTRRAVEADGVLLVLREKRLFEVLVRPGAPLPRPQERGHWHRTAAFLLNRIQEGGLGFYSGIPWEEEGGPADTLPAQAMAVSVRYQGAPRGVLGLFRFGTGSGFRGSDIKLLQSLSEQVGLAVDNSALVDDLKDFLMATVKSLVGAIEAKDHYTSGHSERVNLVSMLIGRQMGLDPQDMETLRWASILHDVGKIGMPEAILQKPSRLTEEEYRIIQQHPDRGFTLLSPIRQLRAAAECVRAHHERVDGRGYPQGLAATEIPLLARIIAVADTYDALTSTRAYRSARTLDFALEEILRVRGTQLDADVVEHFRVMAPFLREHQEMIHPEEEWSGPSAEEKALERKAA